MSVPQLLILSSLILWGSYSAASEPVPAFLEDEPVYTASDPDQPGVLLPLVEEAARELDLLITPNFLPWKKAQWQVRLTPNGLIFPLARTSDREEFYRWICPILDVPLNFITRHANQVIDSYEEAREVKAIGVIHGSPQETQLIEAGIPVRAMPAQDLYLALNRGEIQHMYGARPEAVYGWEHTGGSGDLYFSKPLSSLTLWLAASKDSPAIDAEQWCAALKRVKSRPPHAGVLERYFGMPRSP